MKINPDFNKILEKTKLRLLKLHYDAQVGHLGSNLSCIDALMTVHHHALEDEDQFILSKGHSAGALYLTLWSLGKISESALKTFATIEKKDPTLIEVVIHTKSDERAPSYFYMVEIVPVKDENGDIKKITFLEMLGKKFDLMNREFLAAQFLPTWFNVIRSNFFLIFSTSPK